MQIGMIGLGRMGGNMSRRLVQAGHEVVGYGRSTENLARAKAAGVSTVTSATELVKRLKPPRAVWLMIPHGKPTEDTVDLLLGSLAAGDIIVDGGNSHFPDSARLAERCAAKGVHFLGRDPPEWTSIGSNRRFQRSPARQLTSRPLL